jgi:PAS domain S-box-containing protein
MELIWEVDAGGKIVYVNPVVLPLFGYNVEEVLGMSALGLFHPDEREEAEQVFAEASRLKKEFKGIVCRNVHKAGHVVITELSGVPVLGMQGEFTGFRGSALDITEKEFANEKLRESEERFRATFEQAAMGIAHVAPHGKFLRVNQKFCDIVGHERNELFDMTIQDITNHDDQGGNSKSLQQILRDMIGTFSMEKRYQRKDRSEVWINLTLSLVHDPSEGPKYCMAIIEDITEKKLAKQEKEKLEELLRQSQKMEAIGKLAGGISHDFKNFLTGIMGYASILDSKLGHDSPLRRYTKQILSTTDKAAALTNRLLAFSRKQHINKKMINLNHAIKEVEPLLLGLLGVNIELRTDCSPEDLTVLADAGQIEQVLMNLATNARDAMKSRGCISIKTELEEMDRNLAISCGIKEPGTYAAITFSDTGPGMDKEIITHIFDPFYTTKPIGKGTGLGLSMVYGIIKQHEGFINVNSEVGAGTTFKIFLPFKKVETALSQEKDSSDAPGGNETVLVVEDEDDVRNIIMEVLEEAGYSAIETRDGDEAMQEFVHRRNNIDILLLDMVLPNKNGLTVYDEIKKARPGMKAVFTSGYQPDTILQNGALREGLEFISKPIAAEQLLCAIRRTLDN